MGENKDYMTHPDEMGCIHISEDVLASIAAGAAAEVEYVMVRYGYPIPEVAEKIQNAVSSAVEAMTGFQVKAVNVHVGGVSFQ